MTNPTQHVDWDTLNEFVDGTLPEPLARDVQSHLAQCPACRIQLGDVQQLLRQMQHLEVPEVPAELWPEVRASVSRIAAPPVADVSAHHRPARRTFSFSAQRLAAAAALLVAATASATWLVSRNLGGPQMQVVIDSAPTPLELTATDRQYLATVEQLESELVRTRQKLQPSTIAMVERSLATIDLALDEAREALLADPANTDLRNVLESAYRQKVDFLRRAMQIAAEEW